MAGVHCSLASVGMDIEWKWQNRNIPQPEKMREPRRTLIEHPYAGVASEPHLRLSQIVPEQSPLVSFLEAGHWG